MKLHISRKLITIIVLIIIVLAIPLTIFFLGKQQITEQNAASNADLVVSGFQLTDAGGNVRTTFGVKEDIYVRVRLKNQGTAKGVSTDGHTYTQFYSDEDNAVSPNTVSDMKMSLRNGEFAAGSEKTYESRWGGLNKSYFQGNYIFFRKNTAGTYKARVFINYDGKVDESNIGNNQATIRYTITDDYINDGIYKDGTVTTSPPAGFDAAQCRGSGTVNGVTGCYIQGTVNGRSYTRITNNSTTAKTEGVALFRAYYDFFWPSCSTSVCPEQYIWAWTQTIYSAKRVTIQPGETVYVSLPVPPCYWQVDIFVNTFPLSLHPVALTPDYPGGWTTIGGGWLEQYNGIPACSPTTTPFPSVSPTPTNSPTPTPTGQPSPTPTNSPTPTPTDEPECPVPSQVQNVKIECPFCNG